ncbi:hypothetical protein N7539_008446 [Penicillium diatomitis]|uniref:Uncharacterized protein n=1 Tax=Penicillium diatomitis TaxID=2819901 RepID=A0A9W9WTS4_9EURO|nr:uncharacterized protein N7539_008446 [Penicillium diatomitis]KAJ5475380.1 hypothetical protein N7539_008446 [Penicillium diatomitis]
MSSQKAADLYGVGARLWRKEDLKDIEHQLSHSYTLKQFTVRRINGSTIEILNPFFQVQKPIRKPYVEFQNYWHLVNTEPFGPPQTYLCSYLIEWINETEEDFGRELNH